MTKKTLVLLDTHAILHRAYHALPDFKSSDGTPTGALYGLCLMLMRIVDELKPAYIVACYDLPEKTFRHIAHKGYKAHRKTTEDSLVSQIISSRQILDGFGIPIYDCPGFEADDLLGTICKKNTNKDISIIIASGDMDTLQLVKKDDVRVFTLKKSIEDTILYNEDKVYEKFGFEPKHVADYKGLRGDPSDNIIGVPGVGEKTATILIKRYGTIENIYKELKKKNIDLKQLGITERIKNILLENEEEAIFSKILATIRLDAPIDFSIPPKTFFENINFENLKKLFLNLEFRAMFDRVQTILSRVYQGKVYNTPTSIIIEINDKDKALLDIGFWLLNPEKNKYNIEEMMNISNQKTLDGIKNYINDNIKKNNLDFVYKNIEIPLIPILKKIQNTGILINKDNFKRLSEDYTKELSIIEKKIYKYAGKEFNVASPKQLGQVIFEDMKIHLGIKGFRVKKTATGAFSTKEDELLKLKDIHPIISEILAHREISKLLSTYIDTIPNLVELDGRVHSTFNQMGAATGRFSSENPNMQNIPIRTELGRAIRKCFISSPGYSLVSFDYSQIELRIAALLSQDKYMTDVFINNGDIHTSVAAKILGKNETDITKEDRYKAKAINFGILYGMGVGALAVDMKTNREEAQKFHDLYFENFSSIKNFMNSNIEKARSLGYTETLFGRRRYFPLINSKIPTLKAMSERMAMNAPIQGTATADIIKLAIIANDDFIAKNKIEELAKMLLQVHDELVYEVKDEIIDTFVVDIKRIMENIIPKEYLKDKIAIPLVVDYTIGKNWDK